MTVNPPGNAVDLNNSSGHTTTAVLQEQPHQIQLQQHHQQDQQVLQEQQQMEQQQPGNPQQQPVDDLPTRVNSSAFVLGKKTSLLYQNPIIVVKQ